LNRTLTIHCLPHLCAKNLYTHFHRLPPSSERAHHFPSRPQGPACQRLLSVIPAIDGVHASAHSSPNLDSLLPQEKKALGHHAIHRDWVCEHHGNQPSGRRDQDRLNLRLRLVDVYVADDCFSYFLLCFLFLKIFSVGTCVIMWISFE